MFLRVIIRGLLAYPFIVVGKFVNDLGRVIAGVQQPVYLSIVFHPALGYCVRRANGQVSSWGTLEESFTRLQWELDKAKSELLK